MNKNTQLEEIKEALKKLIVLNEQPMADFPLLTGKIDDIVGHVLQFKFENEDSQIILEYLNLISHLVVQIETMKNEVLASLTKLNSNTKALGLYNDMVSMRNKT